MIRRLQSLSAVPGIWYHPETPKDLSKYKYPGPVVWEGWVPATIAEAPHRGQIAVEQAERVEAEDKRKCDIKRDISGRCKIQDNKTET